MLCRKCGNRIEPEEKFCSRCGAAAEEADNMQQEPLKQGKKNNNAQLIVIAAVIVLLASAIVIGFSGLKTNTLWTIFPFGKNEAKPDKIVEIDSRSIDEEEPREAVKDGEEKPGETPKKDEYIFPSDRKYVTYNDLKGKTEEELALMRNEIYARHGYIFQKEPYKSYFTMQSWYEPNTEFSEALLNDIEKYNRDFIADYEEDLKKPPVQEKPAEKQTSKKRDYFLDTAAEIDEYADMYLEEAMSQHDINRESGVVYEKWDKLLNEVYQYLKKTMSASEFKKLQADEKEWIKEKEAAIEEEGELWEGGSGEAMARNFVGISYTSDRCYYLISLID